MSACWRFVARPLAVLAILGTMVVGSGVPPADAAFPSTSLPLTGITEMVMDDAHSHLFISGYSALSNATFNGTADSAVVVANADGSINTTFTGIDGAAGMFLDAANNKLYVAAYGGNAIQVIDTSTLTLGTSYDLGTAAACPL